MLARESSVVFTVFSRLLESPGGSWWTGGGGLESCLSSDTVRANSPGFHTSSLPDLVLDDCVLQLSPDPLKGKIGTELS